MIIGLTKAILEKYGNCFKKKQITIRLQLQFLIVRGQKESN